MFDLKKLPGNGVSPFFCEEEKKTRFWCPHTLVLNVRLIHLNPPCSRNPMSCCWNYPWKHPKTVYINHIHSGKPRSIWVIHHLQQLDLPLWVIHVHGTLLENKKKMAGDLLCPFYQSTHLKVPILRYTQNQCWNPYFGCLNPNNLLKPLSVCWEDQSFCWKNHHLQILSYGFPTDFS